MYVIVRDDGLFVARPGCKSSYTKFLQHARLFDSVAQAEQEQCPENEHVASMLSFFRM